MSYGPLGFNYLRSGEDLLHIARRCRSRVALLFENALHMAATFRQESLVEIIIGRMWLEGSANQIDPRLAQWAGQPLWPTAAENYDQGWALADVLIGINAWVDTWQGYNEKPNDSSIHQLYLFAAFEAGFTDRLHLSDKRAVVLNSPVGNLNAFDVGRFFRDLPTDFCGAHTYGAQDGQLMSVQPVHYAMRPRHWYAQTPTLPPLIRTEAGTWWPWKGNHPDVRPVSAEIIRQDILWLGEQMLAEPYEVGACLFCCGSNGDERWDGFDLSNEPWIIDAVATFNAEHSGPVPPTPEPPEEEPMPINADERTRFFIDYWQRAGYQYNPANALTRQWTELATAGRWLGMPTEPEHRTEDGRYVMQAFASGVLYCAVGDWANVQEGLPPFA